MTATKGGMMVSSSFTLAAGAFLMAILSQARGTMPHLTRFVRASLWWWCLAVGQVAQMAMARRMGLALGRQRSSLRGRGSPSVLLPVTAPLQAGPSRRLPRQCRNQVHATNLAPLLGRIGRPPSLFSWLSAVSTRGTPPSHPLVCSHYKRLGLRNPALPQVVQQKSTCLTHFNKATYLREVW